MKKFLLLLFFVVLFVGAVSASTGLPARPQMGLVQMGMALITGIGNALGYDTSHWWS